MRVLPAAKKDLHSLYLWIRTGLEATPPIALIKNLIPSENTKKHDTRFDKSGFFDRLLPPHEQRSLVAARVPNFQFVNSPFL